MTGWDENLPIYGRLPGESEAYRKAEDSVEPPIAKWLEKPWDELLVATKGRIDNFYRDFLDPATALPQHLDWLGQLTGFTAEYGLATYPDAVKRQLIAQSFDFIWPNKGTRVLLEWLFSVFSLDAHIYQRGDFLAGTNKAGDMLGGDAFEYWVRVPPRYLRTSSEWKLVERLDRLYSPIYCGSPSGQTVVYEGFMAGFSIAGDPVF